MPSIAGFGEEARRARARCARVGCQHMDVLSDDPAEAEKRRAFRFADANQNTAVGALTRFWLLLPRGTSDPLGAAEWKLCL